MKNIKNITLLLVIFTVNSMIATINLDPYFTDDLYAKDSDNRSIRHITALNCDLETKEWNTFLQERTIRNKARGEKYGMANKKLSLHQMEPDNNGETPEQIANRKFQETGESNCFYLMAYYKGLIHGLNIKDENIQEEKL